MSSHRFVIASKNPKKADEMQSILGDCGVEIVTVSDLRPDIESPEETGTSFQENAALKAMYFAEATGHVCIADDSGLEVDYLRGAPGVYSSRYAGTDGDDAANNRKLLAAMQGVPQEHRGAQFRTVICLAIPGQIMLMAEGVVRGRILECPQGTGGFGYDPLFFFPAFDRSFAEVPGEEKARVSHRGKALRKLKVDIPSLIHILENRHNN